MPNRILRDWTDSYHIEPLSAEAERLFNRLIMKSDDYGRFHGDPRLIRAACFPLLNKITDEDVAKWIAECTSSGCLIGYRVRGRDYLAIVEFKQRLRNEASKFPAPEGFDPEWLPTYDGQLTVNGPPIDRQLTARATHTHTTTQATPTPNSEPPKRPDRLHGIPASVEEVIAHGKTVLPPDGPISEAVCRAFWRHYEGQARTNANGQVFWITGSQNETVITNWKVKLPSFRGDQPHASNGQAGKPRFNRNAGTFNDPAKYDLKDIEKRRALQKAQQLPSQNGGAQPSV